MSFDWMDQAACKDSSIDFFSDTPEEVRAALALCKTCPVVYECLKYTMDARPKTGVYGGIVPHGVSGGIHFTPWPSSMRIAAIKRAERRLREMERVSA